MRPSILNGILRLLPQDGAGKRLLDLSCDDGASSVQYAARGFEVTPTNYDTRRFAVPGMQCTFVDLNRPMPFADASCDCVTLQEVIEHLEDIRAVLREVRRVLRPGGVFVMTTPNRSNLNSRVKYLLTGFFRGCNRPLPEDAAAPNWHVLDFHVLIWLARSAGLQLTGTAPSHAKWTSWLYLPLLYPWIWIGTQAATRRGRAPLESRRSLRKHLLSRNVLVNENLILRFTAV